MAWTKGVVMWIGDYGKPEAHVVKGVFKDVTDAAALDTLATSLSSHTECNIYAKHFNSVTETGATAPGSDVCVDVKAQVVMKDSADGSIHKFLIPAPVAADFELQGQGERMTSTALTAVVTAINTATGKTYIGLYGKKLQVS